MDRSESCLYSAPVLLAARAVKRGYLVESKRWIVDTFISFCPTSPHPITKAVVPVTIGHEFSGIITAIGANIAAPHLCVGQRVAVQPTIYCGACGACRRKAENTCENGGFVGLSGNGGGMSEYVAVPAEAVLPLPSGIDLDVGALVEPLAVAWHAVDASPVATQPPGSAKCLVMGGGPIGLAIVQVLRARGVQLVVCSEVAAKRQEFAAQFGAHHVIDPTKHDIVSAMRELCGGLDGPDVVFDCAGVPRSLATACNVVRSFGTVINLAIWPKEVPFNPNWLVFREANYKGVLGYQRKDFMGVLDALADGSLQPSNMVGRISHSKDFENLLTRCKITGKIQMDRLIEDGYLALINEKDKHVKILVDVRAGT